jgi:hypothetical protein
MPYTHSNKLEYWEDAAFESVDLLFKFYEEFSENLIKYEGREFSFTDIDNSSFVCSKSNLINIQSIIDIYINKKIYLNQEFDDKTIALHKQFIFILSLFSIDVAKDISFNIGDFSMFKEDLVTTLIKKQMDYGPENISKFGITGLTIRMYDKISRLTNLSSNHRKPMVDDEPIFDTALDLIGYCAIAMMWINQTFLLPMKDYSSN